MLSYSKWLDLPMAMRVKIATQFGIIKKGSTEVFNNTIKSDGYLLKDIETSLSAENLRIFVDEPNENDMVTLWNLMLNKMNGIPKITKEDKKEIPVIVEEQVAPSKPVKEESELTKVVKANAKPKKTKHGNS